MTPVNDFIGTITVSCSGLPVGVTCQLNPSTVNFSDSGVVNPEVQNVKLTISAGDDILSSQNRPGSRFFSGRGPVLASGIFALPLIFFRKRMARNGMARLFLLCAALLLGLSTLSACSGNTAISTVKTGTYNVVVTANGNSYTAITPQTVSLSVTVE
jgi:uncharacterized membrane protein